MAIKSSNITAPALSSVKRSILPITARPQFGKGLIYSIQWGFRLDKSTNYAARGEYVGLTANSAQERFMSHMAKVKSLSYSRKGIIKGAGKTDGANRMPRLFYVAFRTSIGRKSYISPNKAYRFISVLEEVNLFDLANSEIQNISKLQTYDQSITSKSYSRYSDIIEEVKGRVGTTIGFNSSRGGEGNKLVKGSATPDEVVMAAFYFITEGRGTEPGMRAEVGILGINLADDINAVFKYFKNKNSYEKLNARKPTHNKNKNAPSEKTSLEKHLDKLGLSYVRTGDGKVKGEISKKTQVINAFLRVSTGAELNLSSFSIDKFISYLLNLTDSEIKEKSFGLMFENIDPRTRRKFIEIVSTSEFFLVSLPQITGIHMLRAFIAKEIKKPDWDFSNEVHAGFKQSLKNGYDILMKDTRMKSILQKYQKELSKKKNLNQKYNENPEDFD